MVIFEVPPSVSSPSRINIDLSAVFTPPDTAPLLVKGDLLLRVKGVLPDFRRTFLGNLLRSIVAFSSFTGITLACDDGTWEDDDGGRKSRSISLQFCSGVEDKTELAWGAIMNDVNSYY